MDAAAPVYRFSSTFTLEAPRERVHDVLVDLEHYGDWWPQVRGVAKIDDDHALVVCRSALPYDLELELTAVSRWTSTCSRWPSTARSVAARRTTSTRCRQDPSVKGPGATRLRFEQEVRAEAPLFVVASYVVKPLLVWNHQRMMRGAERGLRARLCCRGQPSAARAAS